PAQGCHPVLDRPRGELHGQPAGNELLDMLGFQALSPQTAMAHLVQLIGNQIQDVLPIGLGRVAPIAVVSAELLEVIVQVTHRSATSVLYKLLFAAVVNPVRSVLLLAWSAVAAPVGRCEHGTPHPVLCGCFAARQRRTALTWRRDAFRWE